MQNGTHAKRNPARIVAVVAAVAIVAFGVVSFVADRAILTNTYTRISAKGPNLLATYDDYAADHARTPVEFQYMGKTLRGYVYGPENTRGLIVFRHGIFSYHQDYTALIMAMVDKGWRVFAYDAIGCGESDGDNVLGLSQSPLDVAAAVDYARESGIADGMKIALWGHSWGGYGVAAALDLQPEIAACVTMSGFDTPLGELIATAERQMGPLALTQIPTMWLNTFVDFGADGNRSASKAIINSNVPTLIIHGAGDDVVPYEGASIIANAQKDGSTPRNVSTMTLSEPGRSEHNSYFYSPESQAYLNACSADLGKLLEENGGNADAPAVREYIDSIDKIAANTADPALIDEIDGFLSANM